MSVFVTDTHPLLWFTLNQQRNLSPPALRAFTDADRGETYIHIPSLVLYEIAILESLGKISLRNGFLHWTENLVRKSGFGVASIEPEIIRAAVGYSFNSDPFDRVIVATAQEFSLPLITKDQAITNSGLVELLW
ncbi:MAG: type II toxin-antitoxin system VapC family toxin [Pyrinomonadaceae bacterium]